MFYQDSAARVTLQAWLGELLPYLRPDNPDARLLDEITAAEILDCAYVQGAAFDSAVAAHAIYPTYVEESERLSGPSAMSVTFPINVGDEGDIRFTLALRWGRASELKIGQGGYPKVTNPRRPVPDEFLTPVIGGTRHFLAEPGGARLRAVAGPLGTFETTISGVVDRPEGILAQRVLSPGVFMLYGYADPSGRPHLEVNGTGNLVGRPTNADALRAMATYLWSEALPAHVHFEVKWARLSSAQLVLTVAVRNVTPQPEGGEAKDALLAALLLPHVRITLAGGTPDFPALQYAAAKRRFLELPDEDERVAESSRRLYAVQQSGCIATQAPHDPSVVTLSTFGIFDTPREQPVEGPEISAITQSPEAFAAQCDNPSTALGAWLSAHWESVRAAILSAAQAFDLVQLHRFQWEGILANLEFLASNRCRPVTVVRAPTGAGKTIVFFINAAVSALCGPERSTSVLMFPTRLLNEDMFRRLIRYTARLRTNLPTAAVTGGILMGTSDPLYRILLEPEAGEPMHHYGSCPACDAVPLVAVQAGIRLVPECGRCGHRVDYMFNPREVGAYLPDIVIATPDKLFYEATASRWDVGSIGLFGAPVWRCDSCGKVCPEAYIRLKPAWEHCQAVYRDGGCNGTFRAPAVSKLIRYMGFDEVHSLYGETATYLSMFLADLETVQAVLARRRDSPIRYETATATISNEVALIEAISRRRAGADEVVLIPAEAAMHEFFRVQSDTVRHRVLITLPTKASSRETFIRATLNAYLHLRGGRGDLVERLRSRTASPEDWCFLLGYLFKKQEGADLRRSLRDMFRNVFGTELRVEFLSGEAPKDQISRIVQQALAGEIDILLANLVISLGVDIHGLNHMIMLGVPRSFTEYVQTAGRTGRGRSPGHVQIILQPFNPRDNYLYRHFHAVLSDVAGYYDILPVRSTNLFCASQIFGNVAKSLLTALCVTSLPDPQWPHAGGVRAVLARLDTRIRGATTRILGDDPALEPDVRALVDARLSQLQYELARQSGFLAEVMHNSDKPWLLYSLRGRTGSTVRVTCVDQPLLERLRTPVVAVTMSEAEVQDHAEVATDEE